MKYCGSSNQECNSNKYLDSYRVCPMCGNELTYREDNEIRCIDIMYIRANRTYEVILISNANDDKVVYVYNREGNDFRLFLTLEKFLAWQNDNYSVEPDKEFDREEELDYFLETLDIRQGGE